MPPKHIVFDVVGTLLSYDAFYAAIDHRLGDQLRAQGVRPDVFGYLWIEVAEREYAYLSISGAYQPYETVLAAVYHRILSKCRVPSEPSLTSASSFSDLDYILTHGYAALTLRPGAAECIHRLRTAGFTVWCFTMGGLERITSVFRAAGIEMPAERLLDCDEDGVGKPDLRAYDRVWRKMQEAGKVGEGEAWFAAAHMWDVSAAKRSGFRGAYCSVWEGDPLADLFGEMEVVADDLPGMAEKVIETPKAG